MVVLVTIFSEYLKKVPVPVPSFSFSGGKVNACPSRHRSYLFLIVHIASRTRSVASPVNI